MRAGGGVGGGGGGGAGGWEATVLTACARQAWGSVWDGFLPLLHAACVD